MTQKRLKYEVYLSGKYNTFSSKSKLERGWGDPPTDNIYNALDIIKRIVVGDEDLLFDYDGGDMEFTIKVRKEKPKKRYWLWDVYLKFSDNSKRIVKCEVYMDDNGLTTAGEIYISKSFLIKKHEDDFIEV